MTGGEEEVQPSFFFPPRPNHRNIHRIDMRTIYEKQKVKRQCVQRTADDPPRPSTISSRCRRRTATKPTSHNTRIAFKSDAESNSKPPVTSQNQRSILGAEQPWPHAKRFPSSCDALQCPFRAKRVQKKHNCALRHTIPLLLLCNSQFSLNSPMRH